MLGGPTEISEEVQFPSEKKYLFNRLMRKKSPSNYDLIQDLEYVNHFRQAQNQIRKNKRYLVQGGLAQVSFQIMGLPIQFSAFLQHQKIQKYYQNWNISMIKDQLNDHHIYWKETNKRGSLIKYHYTQIDMLMKVGLSEQDSINIIDKIINFDKVNGIKRQQYKILYDRKDDINYFDYYKGISIDEYIHLYIDQLHKHDKDISEFSNLELLKDEYNKENSIDSESSEILKNKNQNNFNEFNVRKLNILNIEFKKSNPDVNEIEKTFQELNQLKKLYLNKI